MNPKVLDAMRPYFGEKFFNPSSPYLPAKAVKEDYEAAKGKIAHVIGAKAADLVMTGGATEANNLAFTVMEDENCQNGTLQNNAHHGVVLDNGRHGTIHTAPKCLYLVTEHDSVRNVAARYNHDVIKVDQTGRVDLEDLKSKIDDSVRLISIAAANNELGTIQPLAEVAQFIAKVRLDRLKRGVREPIYLHSDASQALNLLNLNVARLGVDLMSLNAAKIYGPKGVGALYVGRDVRLSPVSYGGGQEKGLRAGTENVPGVIGFAAAAELAHEHLNGNRKKYARLKTTFLNNIRGAEVVNKGRTLDNFVLLCYNGIDGERLIYLLESQGVYAATGAACAASKGQKSHVLTAIGLSDAEINGTLRITLGETNTEEQMLEAAKIINETVEKEYERVKNG